MFDINNHAEYKYVIAVSNNLNSSSEYSSDIYDLFGNEDGSGDPYIGGKMESPLKWHWNQNGLMKILKFIYIKHLQKSVYSEDQFLKWFKKEKENSFPDSLEKLSSFLYIFKTNKVRMSAFFSKIESMKLKGQPKGKLEIEFSPYLFYVLPPGFYKSYRDSFFTNNGVEDAQKWEKQNKLDADMQGQWQFIFNSASTYDTYHIIPEFFIHQWINNEFQDVSQSAQVSPLDNSRLFVSPIQSNSNEKRQKNCLATDNQIFWTLLSEYVKKIQIVASFSMNYNSKTYEIKEIKTNTLTKSLTYLQEAGAARIIAESLLEVFGEKYIDLEFAQKSSINISESKIIKRAVKIKDLVDKPIEEFDSCDYDYVIDLSAFGKKVNIAFDLTCGLWLKGRGKKSIESYVKQWKYTNFTVPQNNDLILIWHYGLDSTIPKPIESEEKEIGDYFGMSPMFKNTTTIITNNEKSFTYKKSYKSILMPFYKAKGYHELRTELKKFSPENDNHDFKNTSLYKVLVKILKEI